MDWLIEKNPRWGLVLFTFCMHAYQNPLYSLNSLDQLARYQYYIYTTRRISYCYK